MLFSRLNKGLFTSFFDMGKWIRPSLSKYTTLFPSCNHAEKNGFQRGIPGKMRTTEACDELHNTKLLSFCDKKIQGQKENYFDTKGTKLLHRAFAWLVGSHEVGLIGNNESTISSNTLTTHP